MWAGPSGPIRRVRAFLRFPGQCQSRSFLTGCRDQAELTPTPGPASCSGSSATRPASRSSGSPYCGTPPEPHSPHTSVPKCLAPAHYPPPDRADVPCRLEGTVPFLPQLEDVFALSIIKGDAALGPGQADRHFSVVWHSRAGGLRVFVKAKAPTPQDAVHVLP